MQSQTFDEGYEEGAPATKPMAGAMAIVFVCFGFVMALASQSASYGSENFAVFVIAAIVVLFTFIDIEFGLYCLVVGMLLSPEIPIEFIKIPSRQVVVRIEDIMIIVVGLAWLAQVAVRGRLNAMLQTPLNRPILWFSFLTVLSTVRGSFTGAVGHIPTATLYILKFFEFFLLYFLIVNNVSSTFQVRRIMTSYFITLAIVVGWATWTAIILEEYGRATTPFESAEEPGTLGGYLLFSFALAFGLLNYARSLGARITYLALMFAIVPPFLYTLSRGSWLAFFPMFLTVLLLSKRKTFPVALLVIFAAMSPLLPGKTLERVEYTFQDRIEIQADPLSPNRMEVDPSSAARLERYEGVLRQWAYRPLLGQGVTGVGFVDGQIIRVLGEVGILGLLALIWLFRNLVQSSYRLYRALPDGYDKGLALGLIAGAVGLFFHGATANTFIVVRIAGPFWIVVGLVMAIYKLRENELFSRRVEEA